MRVGATIESLTAARTVLADAAGAIASNDVERVPELVTGLNGVSRTVLDAIPVVARAVPSRPEIATELGTAAVHAAYAGGTMLDLATATRKGISPTKISELTQPLESAGLGALTLRPEIATRIQTDILGRVDRAIDALKAVEHADAAAAERARHVVGRQKDVETIVSTLSGTTGNNVMLAADPGAGHRAVLEAVRARIDAGEVHGRLRDRSWTEVDFHGLRSGLREQGEFELRSRALLDAAASRERPGIVVFDGTRAAEPTRDGGPRFIDLFQEYARRGEIQGIVTGTPKDARKLMEEHKLGGLARTHVLEPLDVRSTTAVLRELRPELERMHGLRFHDSAFEAAARLGNKYVRAEAAPGNGHTLIDQAGSYVQNALHERPPRLRTIDAKVDRATRELQQLDEAADPRTADERADLARQISQLGDERTALEARLVTERALVTERIDLDRQLIMAGSAENAATLAATEQIASIDTKLAALRDGAPPLLEHRVTDAPVGAALDRHYGIPVARQTSDDERSLAEAHARVKQRLFGHDQTVDQIFATIRNRRRGILDPDRAMAAALLLGPSGSGKTELGRVFADEVFGDPNAFLRLDMSEFKNAEIGTNRLIGTMGSYKGGGEGGQLTKFLERHPHGVVLLDEVEKADPRVTDILLSAIDAGRVSDGDGRVFDTRNIVFMVTTNKSGQKLIGPLTDNLRAEARQGLLEGDNAFRPEMLARFDVLGYMQAADKKVLREIVGKELASIATRQRDATGVRLRFDPAIAASIAERAFEPAMGARPALRLTSMLVGEALDSAPLARGRVIDIALDPTTGALTAT